MKGSTRKALFLTVASGVMAVAAGAGSLEKSAAGRDGQHRPALLEAVEQLLRDRPELVLSVLETHPVLVADLFERAGEIRKEKIEEEQWRRELLHPKTPAIADDRPVRGPRSAPVTIVEYSDFQCPYCESAARTIRKILADHGAEVRFVYKHNPLPFHAAAEPAARYFEAIALQSEEQAWRFHDLVFEQQQSLSGGEDTLREIAAGLDIDQARLTGDLASPAVAERLRLDQEEARKFGFDGTPAFLVNGVSLIGNQPAEDFERVIRFFTPERQAAAR
jgi:predicted DsbA family dithiol-disulfide isomerase